ncbi:metal ion transport protein [Rhodococcus opacus]|nr:metal ion transport protein [Rhodococcus opacus]
MSLRDPDHALLTQLAAELDFDPHAVEDVVASGERTKATGYATHTFLTVYATRLVDDPIQALDDAIEDLEAGLFDDHGHPHAVQRRTYRVRKELVELRRVVLPMREVIGTVMRHRAERGNTAELDSWYTDLYGHVIRAAEWTESLRDMVTTVFETNLSLQDARLNTVMKKLT